MAGGRQAGRCGPRRAPAPRCARAGGRRGRLRRRAAEGIMTHNSPLVSLLGCAIAGADGTPSGARLTLRETPRLLLRPARMDDVAALAGTLEDWAVAQWLLLPYPIQMSDVARLIANSLWPVSADAPRRS